MQLVKRIPYWGCLFLLAYMPFHVFLSQSLSLLTGGLNEWKVAKDVLLALLTALTVILVWQQRKATKLFNILVVVTTVYALLLLSLWYAHRHVIYKTSAELGFTYDIRLFCYTLTGYGAALLTSVNTKLLVKIVIIVSAIVTAFGLLQYILPSNLLTHFGYSISRGVMPNFFIDNNPEFPRIMSTVRDPNSLGAYLLIPIGLITSFLLRTRIQSRRIRLAVLLVVELLAVYLTFSRSAWLGAIIVVGLTIWWQYRHWFLKVSKRFWPLLLVLVLAVGIVGYTQRNNPILTHQTKLQSGPRDSNQAHLFFVKRSISGIEKDPLGYGPGTAGLASIHDPLGSNLTENYYLQIGYEAGILGLIIFAGVQIYLYIKLWKFRHMNLGLVLLTSFWAYLLINMVLQEWDNEAVAAQWWILAGMVLGLQLKQLPNQKLSKKSNSSTTTN